MFRNWLRGRRTAARRPTRRAPFLPTLEQLEGRTVPSVVPAGFVEATIPAHLTAPTNMEFAPDGRLFVLEQAGNVKLVRPEGSTFTALGLTVDSRGERGLLGIAFDPNYAANHYVYLYYTNPNAGGTATGVHNQVSRFTVDDTDPQQPVFGGETPLLDLDNLIAQAHNGGAIHFGADGMLYVGVGENARWMNSQSLGTLLGKLLRVNVAGYAGVRDETTVGNLIPADNPFVGTATGINQLIYALGLRNPYTMAVQPGTGKIYVNDVGGTAWEEIDEAAPGANYGWPYSEGFRANWNTKTTIGTYTDPVLAYPHGGQSAAIVGGVFYNPANVQFPSYYVGQNFFEDLVNGWIRVFDPAHPGTAKTPTPSTPFASRDAGATVALLVDKDGNLLYLSRGGGIKKVSYHPLVTAIDAGGAAAGTYVADTGFAGGTANAVINAIDMSQVAYPAPESVYQSWRSGDFTYTVSGLTAGLTYTVRLDFSENVATAAGQQVFSATLNGKTVLQNFDVFAAAGGSFKAIERDFTAAADRFGRVVVKFTSVVGSARVNGITVSRTTVPTPRVTAVKAGDTAATLTLAPVAHATSYFVHFGTTAYLDNAGSPVAVGNVTTTRITGLTNGKTYYVWLQAVIANEVGAFSGAVSFRPMPGLAGIRLGPPTLGAWPFGDAFAVPTAF